MVICELYTLGDGTQVLFEQKPDVVCDQTESTQAMNQPRTSQDLCNEAGTAGIQ